MNVKVKLKKGYVIFIFTMIVILVTGSFAGCKANTDVSSTSGQGRAPEYWPTEGWKTSTPEAQGMDSAKIAAMFDSIETYNYDVHHVQIIRNGYTVAECHYAPYEAEDPHIVYSITKSITSSLIGKAIEEGAIKGVDDKVLSYFPNNAVQNASAQKSEMTIKDLLTMSGGMDWVENGNNAAGENSSASFYNSENQVQYMLDLPVLETPGEKFNYSTGSTHILSGLLTEATHMSTEAYAKQTLWEPLGIQSAFWAKDNQNINYGGSRSLYSSGDLAKFGYLFLNKGLWEDQQVLPEKWISESTEKHIETPDGPAGYQGYGYQWWRNPFEGYSARGYGGQYLFVLPETNMVVVFMGDFRNSFFKPESMVKEYLIPACISDKPLKENSEGQKVLQGLIQAAETPEAAVAVQELPTIVATTNGKIFDTENQEKVGIDFEKGKDTATLHWLTDGVQYDIPVGLDQVYRFSQCPDFFLKGYTSKVGFRGTWKNESTFEVEVVPVEAERRYLLTLDFSEKGIASKFE